MNSNFSTITCNYSFRLWRDDSIKRLLHLIYKKQVVQIKKHPIWDALRKLHYLVLIIR